MRRRIAILTGLALLAAAGCGGDARWSLRNPADASRIAGWKGRTPNSADTFRFVVLSDRTGGHEPGAWEQAVEEINRLRPDFVISVGDLIEGHVEDENELLREWEEFDAITRSMDAPFFYCPGNHDVAGEVPRRVYTRLHGIGGKTYYSFAYRNFRFMVLDSTALLGGAREVAAAQWKWLKKELAASGGAKHLFIFAHHPLWTFTNGKRVLKLLNPKKTTVFCGHWHVLSYGRERGIRCFALGPTATQISEPDRAPGRFRSYAHVVVSAGKPTISIIPLGEVLPHDIVPRAVESTAQPPTGPRGPAWSDRHAGRAGASARRGTAS